jgi:hypothetical protein
MLDGMNASRIHLACVRSAGLGVFSDEAMEGSGVARAANQTHVAQATVNTANPT